MLGREARGENTWPERSGVGQAAGLGRLLATGMPPPRVLAALGVGLLGITSLWPTVVVLHWMWVTDPLKSIGMLVPPVSLALLLWRWKELGWEFDGTWWGLALLVATAAAVRFREQSVLVLVLSPRWSVYFPPHSFVVLAYVTGWVLLFGGWRLLCAARFPVLLTLLVNPVPHIFNVYVDLPLQRVSAHVARGFALLLHQKLTPDQMRLMFTPDFGMFIAPGCNGIRGAVTMGLIALVVGYLYQFRTRAHVFFVLGAVLLGYVFNFVRLCTLVLYYMVALKLPWLQDRAEMGDYVIGACLFLFAVWLLFQVVRLASSSRATSQKSPERSSPLMARSEKRLGVQAMLRLGAMTLLAGVTTLRVAHGALTPPSAPRAVPDGAGALPPEVGKYQRARAWTEQMPNGPILYEWADYAPAGAPSQSARSTAEAPDPAVESRSLHVALGISPVLGSHDVSVCHSSRGEDPIWHGAMRTQTAAGERSFSSSFFNNGATQFLEVTTICNENGCGEYSAGTQKLGFIYSRPAPVQSLVQDPKRPLPMMFRVETLDTAMPADMAREELTQAARDFLAGLNLEQVAATYR